MSIPVVSNAAAAASSVAPDTVRTWSDHWLVQQRPLPTSLWESAGRGVSKVRKDAELAARTHALLHPTFGVRLVRPN